LTNLVNEKEFSAVVNKQEIINLIDKKEQEQFLMFMFLTIEKEIKRVLNKEQNNKGCYHFNLKELLNISKITKDTIEKAAYNVNMELLFDNYFIKIGELML